MILYDDLQRSLATGNVCAFVGAGLSAGAGLPGWYDLIAELSARIGYELPPAKWATGDALIDAAQAYVNRQGLHSLISHLKDRLDTTGGQPTAVHHALAQLPLSLVFTANFDDLLERAFRDAGKRIEVVVKDSSISFMRRGPDTVSIVKLYGDLDQPDTIVLARQQYESYFLQRPQMVKLLEIELARSDTLYLGWSGSDPYFKLVFGELLSRFGGMMRPGYAVMFDVTDDQRDELQRKQIRLVELPAGDRAAQLTCWLNSLLEKGGGTMMDSDLVERATAKHREAIAARDRGELVLAHRLGVEACGFLSRVVPKPGLLAEIHKFLESVDYKPVMLLIPAGFFFMGSDKDADPMAEDRELPQHELWLPEYHIAETPTTNEQYFAFVRTTGKRAPWYWEDGRFPSDKEQHPVVWVSWKDADEYCRWLSELTGKDYRLPTEAQWEKAARGTDKRIYPWGKENPDDMHCNFGKGGYVKGGTADTTPVDTYPKGANGLRDMAGNVWEWTRTLWNWPYPYKADDGREDPSLEDACSHRGGSFVDYARFVRCACRAGKDFPHSSSWNVGFRVVMNSAPQAAGEGEGVVAYPTWNRSAIRQLLTDAFNDEELTTFCFDRFPAVYEAFGSGMSKGDKILRLLDYCVRHEQVETLLTVVQKANPTQYQRYERQLRG